MRLVKHILPVLCLTLVTIFISHLLFTSMMEYENERCWKELQVTTEATASDIRTKFQDEITKLYLIGRLMLWDNILDADSLERLRLEEVQPKTFFSRIDVLYPDGTLALNGKKSELRYDAFEELASKGAFLSSRQEDAVTGKPSVYYVLPVKQDGNAVAIVIGVIHVESLSNAFSVNIYDGQANICIVDSTDGNFIMDSWHSELGNFYQMETREMMEEYRDADPSATVRNQETGAVGFVSQTTGKNIYMYYTPVHMFDWQLLIFATDDVIFSGLLVTRRLITIAGIAEALLILLYLAWNLRVVRQLERSNDEIQLQKERLEFLSYTDVLTSVYNRHKYSEMLSELRQSELEKVGIVYIDLNGLKEINDTQLHDAGDRYIQNAARILQEVFGRNCYRIGGDEFVVLVSGMEEESFSESLKRMQQRADEEQVSFSVGALWQDRCEGISELLREAEEKMYCEKKKYHTKHDRRKSE